MSTQLRVRRRPSTWQLINIEMRFGQNCMMIFWGLIDDRQFKIAAVNSRLNRVIDFALMLKMRFWLHFQIVHDRQRTQADRQHEQCEH